MRSYQGMTHSMGFQVPRKMSILGPLSDYFCFYFCTRKKSMYLQQIEIKKCMNIEFFTHAEMNHLQGFIHTLLC